jgi:hypothetical protein
MTADDVGFVLLVLFTLGAAISSSVCAVLLKREVEAWWARNYGNRGRDVVYR